MQILFKTGTAEDNSEYTGRAGTLTVDLDNFRIRVHDGVTKGGHEIPNVVDVAQVQSAIENIKIQDFDGYEAAFAVLALRAGLGEPNGIATLDSNGLIPSTQLPSFVDDIVEVDELEDLPEVGEGGKIYISVSDGKMFRWISTSEVYQEITLTVESTDDIAEGSLNEYFSNAKVRIALSATGDLSFNEETGVLSYTESVSSVNGDDGTVVINKASVGLGDVQNYGFASEQEVNDLNTANKYVTPLDIRSTLEAKGLYEDEESGWTVDCGFVDDYVELPEEYLE